MADKIVISGSAFTREMKLTLASYCRKVNQSTAGISVAKPYDEADKTALKSYALNINITIL